MPSLRNLLKRISTIASEAPIDEDRCDDLNEFRLPTNPRDVKLQDSEPQSLPSVDADVHTVRFFLYHLLTFRGNQVAKRWPQWVLETVSYWKGDGKALRLLEGDLTHLCPMRAGYAQLGLKVSRENSPSGDCRTQIGMILSTKIKRLKDKETRQTKAHEEWKATQQGRSQPWSRSVTDLRGNAGVHPSSQYRLRSVPSGYPRTPLYNTSTMPDLRAMYNAHAVPPTTPDYHAPSIVASGYAIPRASSTVQPKREVATGMVYSSSVETPGASGDRSSGTYITDATSLPQSPKSLVSGIGKQPLQIPPPAPDGCPFPNQEELAKGPSIASDVASTHNSIRSSTSFHTALTSQKVALVEADMNNVPASQSAAHSTRERSKSVSSYATSRFAAPAQHPHHPLDSGYPHLPCRYREGTLRTAGEFPHYNSMSFPHSGISGPRDRTPSVVSSIRPVSPHIVHATPPGLLCGQNPIPPRTPSRQSHTPSRLSQEQNIWHTPLVDSFTGPLRSANTASLDNHALSQGDNLLSYTRKMQSLGIYSAQRKEPAHVPHARGDATTPIAPSTRIIDPDTGLPRITCYEAIVEKQRLDMQKTQK